MTVIAWDRKRLATDKMRPHGEGFFRFPRIPTERPSQAVFMWGGCRPCLHGRFLRKGRPRLFSCGEGAGRACMDDLVVKC